MIEQDSIAHSSMSVQGGDSVVAKHVTLTPRMVLSWLPRDATPAQQDSAIQAHFKPSEIRWSKRPDTLHLPGHDKGHNMLDTQLPQYYREGFFSKDTLLHPELPGGRYGVAGDPVPYSVHGDSFITTLLLVLFVMALISISNAWGFIVRQVKGFGTAGLRHGSLVVLLLFTGPLWRYLCAVIALSVDFNLLWNDGRVLCAENAAIYCGQ